MISETGFYIKIITDERLQDLIRETGRANFAHVNYGDCFKSEITEQLNHDICQALLELKEFRKMLDDTKQEGEIR